MGPEVAPLLLDLSLDLLLLSLCNLHYIVCLADVRTMFDCCILLLLYLCIYRHCTASMATVFMLPWKLYLCVYSIGVVLASRAVARMLP